MRDLILEVELLRLLARQAGETTGSWMQLDDASFLEASSAAVRTLNRRIAGSLMTALRAEAAAAKVVVLMMVKSVLVNCCSWRSSISRRGASA